MGKLVVKWRNRFWRREVLKTVGGWVVSGLARELARWALSLWLRP